MMSKEQMIATIKECAEKLGRTPTVVELKEMSGGEVTMGRLTRLFGTYGRALAEAGLERQDNARRYTLLELFQAWAALARVQKRLPTFHDFYAATGISGKCLLRSFRYWRLVAPGLLQFMEENNLEKQWDDVADMIRRDGAGRPKNPWTKREAEEEAGMEATAPAEMEISGQSGEAGAEAAGTAAGVTAATSAQAGVPWHLAGDTRREAPRGGPCGGRKRYGAPIWHPAMSHAPTNEDAVLVLLGAMAQQLGLVIMRIQKPFPDGEGMRLMDDGSWEHVFFEVELLSRNFVTHMHDPRGCDFIICWEHNWPECPLPVIELRKLVPGG